MRMFRSCVLAVHLALVGTTLPSVAMAQFTVDASRVTCAEFLVMPPDQSRILAAWLSGYFNQKAGYAWINFEVFEQNIAGIRQRCASRPDELIMSSLQQATAK